MLTPRDGGCQVNQKSVNEPMKLSQGENCYIFDIFIIVKFCTCSYFVHVVFFVHVVILYI